MKKYFLILIVLLTGFGIGNTVKAETNVTSSKVGITFVDGKDSPGSNNGENNSENVDKEGSLPKTGQLEDNLFLILGMIIIGVSYQIIVYKSKKEAN